MSLAIGTTPTSETHGTSTSQDANVHVFWERCARSWSERLRSPAAKRTVQGTFWGEVGALTLLVRTLAANFPGYSAFIDVGAGEYSFYDRTHSVVYEGSNAMQFYRLWSKPQHRISVLAFEPNTDNPLYQTAKKTDGQVMVLPFAITNVTGQVHLRGIGNIATINERLLVHPHFTKKQRRTRLLNATTVDEMARLHIRGRLDLLKTDSEGADWEAILGATQTLSDPRRRPRVLIMAYEDKWSQSTYFAAYPSPRRRVQRRYEARTPQDMQLPTLRSVAAHLHTLEYSTYLIGSTKAFWRRKRKGCDAALQFIPVSPPYWDDAFELAFRPQNFGLLFSWFDIVAVVKASAEEQLLQRLSACGAGGVGGGAPVCGGGAEKVLV